MNSDQVTGIVRAIISAIGGYFVGQGILDASTVAELSGALATLVAVGWSIHNNQTGKVVGVPTVTVQPPTTLVGAKMIDTAPGPVKP